MTATPRRPLQALALALAVALSLGACATGPGSVSAGPTPTPVPSPSPSPSPSPTPTPSPAPSGRWLMGYVVGYERDRLPLDAVHWSAMTHVAVGRAIPRADGTLATHFDIDEAQGPVWAKAVVARAHAAGVKAILMIGGAGERDGFVGAASAARRAAFVQNILRLVTEYGFDGVDLDWEPLEAADEAPLKALAGDLRAARPGLLLTLPVNYVNTNDPAGEARPSYASIAPLFDQINIMSYAMAGVYEGWKSWHSSALIGHGSATPTSVAGSVDAYLAAGVPARKLGLGIGFFGMCYRGVTGPRQDVANAQIVAGDGDMNYADLVGQYFNAAAKRYDDAAKVPYLSSTAGLGPRQCNYVTYEDAQSIAEKMAYAKSKGLGGAIVWTVAQGHLANGDPLLDAAREGLNR